jgi:hypothetical protein
LKIIFIIKKKKVVMSSSRESVDTVREETPNLYSVVSKLVHYTSKFTPDDDRRDSISQTFSRNNRRQSTLDTSVRFVLFIFRLKVSIF